jgi:imidazoleglycerol phosphate synthase glutamine amidotransferase subunit HisH
MISRDNFVAAQFHPERSSSAGSQMLRNFIGLSP